MVAYILRRIITALTVVVVTLVASFTLFFAAPTDPAGQLCGRNCTPERIRNIEDSLHLNDPYPAQVGTYIKGIFVGRNFESGGTTVHCSAPCLGYSYQLSRPVTEIISHALPVTVSIVLVASATYVLVGTTIGILAARRRGTVLDRMLVGASLGIGSIPYPVVALLSSVYVVGIILPQEQWTPITDNPALWFSGLLGAWLTLIVIFASGYVRYARSSMIESLSEDFVRTARAKGISERRVIYRHALRAAITPVVTIYGLDLAFSLAGAIFTESAFGLPGLGLVTLRAFNIFDLPVLMGTVLVGSTLLVTMNLIVDILYTVLDPRVRLG